MFVLAQMHRAELPLVLRRLKSEVLRELLVKKARRTRIRAASGCAGSTLCGAWTESCIPCRWRCSGCCVAWTDIRVSGNEFIVNVFIVVMYA